MSAVQKEADEEKARTELEDVLAHHNGDALASLQSLLNDCRNLREQLVIVEQIMSRGYVRGWKPKYE